MARNSLEHEPEENPTALFQVKRKQVLVSACTCNFWKNFRDICRHQFAHTLLSIPLMPGGSCMSFICYWRDQGYFGSLPPPKTFNQILQTYCRAHFLNVREEPCAQEDFCFIKAFVCAHGHVCNNSAFVY